MAETPETSGFVNYGEGAFSPPNPLPVANMSEPQVPTLGNPPALENTPPIVPPPGGGTGPQLPPRDLGGSGASKPYNKAEFFRNMLGQFFYSVGTGLANRGSGPDADARGAGAALTALPERNMMQAQIAIQRQQAESEAALRKAQADKATQEAQSVPVTLGNGQQVFLPASIAKQILAAQTTGQSREKVASTNATSRENVADTGANSRENVAQIGAESRQNVAATNAANKPPTELSLLMSVQRGGPDAANAQAALTKLQQNRLEVAKARGPASRPMNFYDPELGRNVILGASEAEAQQKSGKTLIQAGSVPADKIMQMQRASNAIPAALDEVQKHIKAWDNPEDAAIFAKIIKENPAGNGEPSTWFSSVLDRAAQSKLSEDGQAAVISLRRLNDSLGSLRVISGLPSTVGSMMTTAALAPGATTPNSKVAKQQLDSIRTLVQQETGIKFLGGGTNAAREFAKNKAGESNAKGPVSMQEAQKYLQQAGGDKNKARALAKADGRSF